MRLKLGLFTEEDGDRALIRGLLEIMHQSEADFTLTFRRLCAAAESEVGDAPLAALFKAPDALRDWLPAWRSRLAREPQPRAKHAAFMRLVNPFVIPRNHRIEAVIAAAVAHGDYAPFERLSQVLARPYEERAEFAAYTEPALPAERVTQTFCGT
jgi:uncharacterized protein YdiU (UPF0061 family)